MMIIIMKRRTTKKVKNKKTKKKAKKKKGKKKKIIGRRRRRRRKGCSMLQQHEEHRLNSTERKQAKEAIADKEWLGKFSFGHDQAGARRPYPVVQIRGKVITVNNISDLNESC